MTHPRRPLPPLVLEGLGRPEQPGTGSTGSCILVYGDRRDATQSEQLGEALHVHFHPTARGLPPAHAHVPR